MDNNKWSEFYHKYKRIFSLKRTRATLYVAMVLWVAVITQVVVNRLFHEELQITEAFIKSDTLEMQSSLEIVAEYNETALSEAGKKELIYKLAKSIGLDVDGDITIWEEDSRSEYFYFKQAKKASTEIKVVSLETKDKGEVQMEHYIVVRLNIQKGIQSIDKYKDLMEKELSKLGVDHKQVMLKYEGNREGDMTSQEKHEMAVMLVNELQGEVGIEYDEGDLYTVYAYTGMINEYVTTMENKINIQVAITYNELTDTTKITLATPVLNESF